MAELTLKSAEIHCESCGESVKKVLATLPGVQSVSVNVQEKTVKVAFEDPTKVEDIRQALTEAGFPPTEEI